MFALFAAPHFAQGALTVKFKGSCVPIESDEPFEEHKCSGRMKQNLPFVRNFSIGQKMCAIFGRSWSGNVEAGGLPVRAPPPKTTASCCEGPLRQAPPARVRLCRRCRPQKVSPATKEATLRIRKDECTANSVQAHMFCGRCATDTAITEVVRSWRG